MDGEKGPPPPRAPMLNSQTLCLGNWPIWLPLDIIQYGSPQCAQCSTLWLFELWLLAHACGFDADKHPCFLEIQLAAFDLCFAKTRHFVCGVCWCEMGFRCFCPGLFPFCLSHTLPHPCSSGSDQTFPALCLQYVTRFFPPFRCGASHGILVPTASSLCFAPKNTLLVEPTAPPHQRRFLPRPCKEAAAVVTLLLLLLQER